MTWQLVLSRFILGFTRFGAPCFSDMLVETVFIVVVNFERSLAPPSGFAVQGARRA